jgi:PAS domain S-box-containing protein
MDAITGVEVHFDEEEIIVSKTDTNGRISYANDVFLRVAGYRQSEVIGQPHSMIRHPDMPRSVFSLLWSTIQTKHEIFAYVVNRAKNGDHYWVFAHVTPTFGLDGQIIGYHSNRRAPTAAALAKVKPLYAALMAEERRHADKAAQIAAGTALLQKTLSSAGKAYDEFVFSLGSE